MADRPDDVIRGGRAEDVDPCARLWTRVIVLRDGEDVAADVDRLVQEAFTRPVVRFAVIDPGPTAFALTVVRSPRVARLSRLCVDPTAAGRGAGGALVLDAVHHARDSGFARLELDVRTTNERAIALYARAGFRQVSDPWPYDEGDPLTTWSLDLTDDGRPAATEDD